VVVVWFVIITFPAFLLFTIAGNALAERPLVPAIPPLIWRGFAAVIAFAIWALSVPTNPVQTQLLSGVGGAVLAGFLAIAVSPVLAAIDAIVMSVFNAKPSG
jgi:hypothetical protein